MGCGSSKSSAASPEKAPASPEEAPAHQLHKIKGVAHVYRTPGLEGLEEPSTEKDEKQDVPDPVPHRHSEGHAAKHSKFSEKYHEKCDAGNADGFGRVEEARAARETGRLLVRQDTKQAVQHYLAEHQDKDFLKNGKVDGRRGNTAAQRAARPHIVESSKVPGVRPSPAIINQKANYEKPESPRTFEQAKRDAEERLKPAKQVAVKCSSPHCHFQAHPDPNETQGQGSYCCKTCKKSGAYGGAHGGRCRMVPWVPPKRDDGIMHGLPTVHGILDCNKLHHYARVAHDQDEHPYHNAHHYHDDIHHRHGHQHRQHHQDPHHHVWCRTRSHH